MDDRYHFSFAAESSWVGCETRDRLLAYPAGKTVPTSIILRSVARKQDWLLARRMQQNDIRLESLTYTILSGEENVDVYWRSIRW